MAKYLFVYRDSVSTSNCAPSPAEIQAALEQWGAWIGKFAAKGNIADGGDGLKPTGKLLRPNNVVTDGPFVESKEVVGGYSIIQADSYDAAVAVAKECPCVLMGGSIEIRELAGYN